MTTYLYHWDRLKPRNRVHLSLDGEIALCGRCMRSVDVVDDGIPWIPYWVETALSMAIMRQWPLCIICWRKSRANSSGSGQAGEAGKE